MASGSLFSSAPVVQAQLRDLAEIAAALLGQHLVGVYLGSSEPGQLLNAAAPALHLLVVTARDVRRDTKLGLVQALLRRSSQPAALEVLVVRQADLAGDTPSLLIQLHFAEGLRPQLTTDSTSLLWLSWPDGPSGAVERASVLDRLQRDSVAIMGPPLPTFLSPAAAETPATPTDVQPPPPRPAPGRQLTLE